ncbi:hypothetical protein FACS1894104_2760 [Actinomycetota bacterium]|nr:hypothetical protein FACS1894104_2760 [Actinomycetota bacterium]
MIVSNVDSITTSSKPKGKVAFWLSYFFALAALCLSLGLLTGCEPSGANSSQASSASQGADDLGSGNAGFVVEDTAVVNVEIDEG